MVERLEKFCYPKSWGLQRLPRRVPELRVFDFAKNYDWHTIWNDALQINPETVLLIGPPLYEHGALITSACKLLLPDGAQLATNVFEIDRACVTAVQVPRYVDQLILSDMNGVSHPIAVNQPSFEFINQKVIFTICKNHPISWLQQWIDYHRTVHNLDGLLLYNNQSTMYNSSELESAISRDDMTIRVVDYDVPFGCMGGGDWEWNGRRGDHLPWDSDFSQYVMFEHAKWRYLHCAKLAINADTDELLYLKNDQTLDQIAEQCETSNNTAWSYTGTWIEPVNSITKEIAKNTPFEQRCFANYWHTQHQLGRGLSRKWMLNPKSHINRPWHLHDIHGPHLVTDEIGFGHFLPMNTSWSYVRDEFTGNINQLVPFIPIEKHLAQWRQKSQRFLNSDQS